ncbi:CaiB/BaiF CoA transferase family protein [Chloroflexota bacterium]
MYSGLALEGVKVVEIAWAVSGPQAMTSLAENGATVVKLESIKRIDPMRAFFPYAGGIPGLNRCITFAQYNIGKLSIKVDLSQLKGFEIAKKLIAWADVFIEGMVPGAAERMGLGYEEVRKIKPDIIMMSTSMEGRGGPHSTAAGIGAQAQALSGFTSLFGWPDREPVGTPISYTDWITPWYIIIAAITALEHRRHTGEGTYIDISQFESGVSFLSPAVLDYCTNGREATAKGNRSNTAPHSVYRCEGDDEWCAIAVFNEDEWAAFCKVIGEPQWCQDTKFSTSTGRKQNEDELDRLVEAWTVNYPAQDIMDRMQSAGVPAGKVQNGRDLHQDPQLKHRQHFWRIEHPEIGVLDYDGPSFRMSKTNPQPTRPAPCIGEHTEYICRNILGIPDNEFVQLLNDGVFE